VYDWAETMVAMKAAAMTEKRILKFCLGGIRLGRVDLMGC
jgi:predicted sulfurtransferase